MSTGSALAGLWRWLWGTLETIHPYTYHLMLMLWILCGRQAPAHLSEEALHLEKAILFANASMRLVPWLQLYVPLNLIDYCLWKCFPNTYSPREIPFADSFDVQDLVEVNPTLEVGINDIGAHETVRAGCSLVRCALGESLL